VGTTDSKIGMYTMNINAKENDRCLYLYRFRPKPVNPPQIDYIWKGEEESVKEQNILPILNLERKRTSSLSKKEKEHLEETKKEVVEESNFITLNTLAKTESEDVYIHSSKKTTSKLSQLHHFQQLAEPSYQHASSSSFLSSTSTSTSTTHNPDSLSGHSKEMRGGTGASRICTVDTCLIT